MKTPPAIPALWQRLLAELIGTFFLVACGCGAIVVEAQTGRLGHVGVSLTFGLIIAVMVAATGHISGAHFNPAVTLAFTSIRVFPWQEVPAYIAAQLVGASLGAGVLLGIFGNVATLGSTIPAGSASQSLWLEMLLTSCLMFSIAAVATDARAPGPIAAIVIGSAVALGALWGGPTSGASMNPARSLGPALVSGTWQDHWLYWVGPIVGAVGAAVVYRGLSKTSK